MQRTNDMTPQKFSANLLSDDLMNLDPHNWLIVNDRFKCIPKYDEIGHISISDANAPTESTAICFITWDSQTSNWYDSEIVVTYHRDLDKTTSSIYLKECGTDDDKWLFNVNIISINTIDAFAVGDDFESNDPNVNYTGKIININPATYGYVNIEIMKDDGRKCLAYSDDIRHINEKCK